MVEMEFEEWDEIEEKKKKEIREDLKERLIGFINEYLIFKKRNWKVGS